MQGTSIKIIEKSRQSSTTALIFTVLVASALSGALLSTIKYLPYFQPHELA